VNPGSLPLRYGALSGEKQTKAPFLIRDGAFLLILPKLTYGIHHIENKKFMAYLLNVLTIQKATSIKEF